MPPRSGGDPSPDPPMRTKKALALQTLRDWEPRLACPLCGGAFFVTDAGLGCAKGHRFDVNAKGAVQLCPVTPDAHYPPDLFRARQTLVSRGLFDGIAQAVADLLRANGAAWWLDAGCGDGALTKRIAEACPSHPSGLDWSQAAIRAAGNAFGGQWPLFVGGVRRLPLRPHAADAIVNAFAPAAYDEFLRALGPGGLLVKVAPDVHHLRELRLQADPPSGADAVEARFREAFPHARSARVTRAFPVDPADWPLAARFSPVTVRDADAALARLSETHCAALTVDARVLWAVA